jgi:hypothetical protein
VHMRRSDCTASLSLIKLGTIVIKLTRTVVHEVIFSIVVKMLEK